MFSRFLKLKMSTWFCIFLGIIILTIARIIMLYHFGDDTVFHRKAEISRAFKLGFLFDLQTLSVLLIVSMGIAFILLPLKKVFTVYHRWIYPIYCTFVLTIVFIFAIINLFYYDFFNTRIDMNFLEILVGQADATLAFIWQKYPVIKISILLLLFILLTFFLLMKVHHRVYKFNWNPHWSMKVITIVATLFLFILALAGGVIDLRLTIKEKKLYFGLQTRDAYFSRSNLINNLSQNGIRGFIGAYKDKIHFVKPKIVNNIDGLNAYNLFFNQKSNTNQFSLNNLYTYTSKKVYTSTHPKPSVVFAQMESMGRHFLIFDNEKNNLLGSLGPYFKHDFIFKNFLSGANHTQPTLAMLMLYSPLEFVFENFVCSKPLPSSVAKPFKDAGYRTVFLTSGSGYFARLEHFLPKHGFDEVIDKENLLQEYPHAEAERWGIYDEYVFQYAYKLLQKAEQENQPIFIYVNTVTNHTPYTTPDKYHPYPIQVPPGLAERLHTTDKGVYLMFSAYQYVNDCLGKFIQQVDKSSFGKHIIIAASGDHNFHEMKPRYPNYQEYGLRYAVPFYLHVPKDYQNNIVYDPNRIGSHKDIFPTLYSLALSHARYLNLGNNLLSAKQSSFQFGYNPLSTILPDGLITTYENESPKFYPWLNNEKIYVGEGHELSDAQKITLKRIQSYQYLLYWQLNKNASLAQCH